jgi:AcrR family transcriptional regulator
MPSDTTTPNGLSRREELLAVATKLFAARGCHGTRMDDVADVVGLNKATVYHYYASKSLILFDITAGPLRAHWQRYTTIRLGLPGKRSTSTRSGCSPGSRATPSRRPCISRSKPYITEWFTEEQVAEIREKETQVYEHVHGLIDRGIASGEFYDWDSHVLALGYIGMTLGSYRWLRPSGRRAAKEIAAEFSTTLLRGLIRDESIRTESPLGVRTETGTAARSS